MCILVYGFGPYRQFQKNITQEIVGKLRPSRRLKKIVFPVRFDRRQFTTAIKKYRPDSVLGLGQCSAGRLLRIERRAVNKRRDQKKERPRSILGGGSKWLPTDLKLEKSAGDKQAKISYDAGDYVCNFSMYVILDYLRRHRLPTRFGFIHVPHTYDPKRAVRCVGKVLKVLAAGSGSGAKGS